MHHIYSMDDQRKYRLLMLIFFLAIPILAVMATEDLINGRYWVAMSQYFLLGGVCYCFFVLKKEKSESKIKWSSRLVVFQFGCCIVTLYIFEGKNFGQLLWIFVFPLVSFFMLNEREGLIWVAVVFLVVSLILFSPSGMFDVSDFAAGQKIRLLISFLLVCAMIYAYERIRNIDQTNLERSNEELKQVQQQLVQAGKLASIGELAAGVAHELNQPLMLIRGNAQLILRSVSKKQYDIEMLEDDLNTIVVNSKRMMTIINHLGNFSRQSEKTPGPVDINEVIKGCLLMIKEQLRLHDIELILNLAPDLSRIQGMANRLEQVFLNLLTNARDAIEQKRVADPKSRGVIEFSTRNLPGKEGGVEILIKDTGGGITGKNISSIFDPFFTTKAVGKGVGLGLSISYGIIGDHHGTIDVRETGPEGTTFGVRLLK